MKVNETKKITHSHMTVTFCVEASMGALTKMAIRTKAMTFFALSLSFSGKNGGIKPHNHLHIMYH
jgi:hypothetical protein